MYDGSAWSQATSEQQIQDARADARPLPDAAHQTEGENRREEVQQRLDERRQDRNSDRAPGRRGRVMLPHVAAETVGDPQEPLSTVHLARGGSVPMDRGDIWDDVEFVSGLADLHAQVGVLVIERKAGVEVSHLLTDLLA